MTSRQKIINKAEEYGLEVGELRYDRDFQEWRLLCSRDSRCEQFYGSCAEVIDGIENDFTKPVKCDCCNWVGDEDDLGNTGNLNGNLPICPMCSGEDTVEAQGS